MAAGERTIRIRFDGTVAGLVKAAKVAENRIDKFRKATDKFSTGVTKTFAKVEKAALTVGVLGLAIQGTTAIVGGLVATLPALAVLPGILASAAAAAVVLKLGGEGITAAFEHLTPVLDDIKAGVSAAFEETLLPGVEHLQGLLPQLRGGLMGIAAAMGTAASGFFEWLSQEAQVADLNGILAVTEKVAGDLGATLAPLGQALLDIAAVGSAMFSEWTAGAGNAAQRFADFIRSARESGKLRAWIQGGIDAVKRLWEILGNLVGIITGIFTGISSGMDSVGGSFVETTGKLKDFIQSAKGQGILKNLGKILGTIAQTVGGVLMTALRELAPILPNIVKALSQFAQQAGPILGGALRILGPLLAGIAKFLADNIRWIGPLVISLVGLALAFKGVNLVLGIMRTLLMTNPFVLLAIAVVAIVTLIITYWTPIAQFFADLWAAIWGGISTAWTAIGEFFTTIWGGISTAAQTVWGLIQSYIIGPMQTAWDWLVGAWTTIGSVLGSIWQGISDTASNIWNGIKNVIKGVVNGIITIINGAITGINVFIDGYNFLAGSVGDVIGLDLRIGRIPKIPKLERGGEAKRGRTYLTGEKGPELFTPNSSGRVTPNDQLGGGAPTVQVFIDGREFKGMIRTEIGEANRGTRRRVAAGAGAAR